MSEYKIGHEKLNVKEYFDHNNCKNIFKHLSNIEILKKNSISDAILISATLNYEDNEENIILKIFLRSNNILNNSLIVEEEIYRNIISSLLLNNHTPHLI